MKSKNIRKKIKSISDEVENLQSKLSDVENSLTRKKQSINFDNSDSLEEIKSLKNEKDLILELIEEKQVKLTTLKADLDIQAEQENREQALNELIGLARQAESLENEFNKKLSELDEILSEKIPEIISVRNKWEKTAKEFMSLGDSTVGKGLKQSTTYTKSRNGQFDELTASEFMEELEGKGINLKPVTSGEVLSSQHFTHISNVKDIDLFFGENLYKMMNQRNIGLLLAERKHETA